MSIKRKTKHVATITIRSSKPANSITTTIGMAISECQEWWHRWNLNYVEPKNR